MPGARHPRSLTCSSRYTSDSFALGHLVPLLKAAPMSLISGYLGFQPCVWFKNVTCPCCVVATIVFRRVLPRPSVSSHQAGDGGSSVVGLGALSPVNALSDRSSSVERSSFCPEGLILSSLLVSVLSVCLVLLGWRNKKFQSSLLWVILAAGNG